MIPLKLQVEIASRFPGVVFVQDSIVIHGEMTLESAQKQVLEIEEIIRRYWENEIHGSRVH